MRDLWRGLTLLARDVDLRKDVFAAAAELDKAEFEQGLDDAHQELKRLHLRRQPNPEALRNIDRVFRTRGLFLSVYGLAEVNRWIMNDKQGFHAALEGFRQALEASPAGAQKFTKSYEEAIGALVADERLRDKFGKVEEDLLDNGFGISPEEERALRASFVPSGKVDEFADLIFRIGWSGSCGSAFLVYDSLFHFNM